MENPNDPNEITASLVARVQQNVPRYFIDAALPDEREAHFRWLFLGGS